MAASNKAFEQTRPAQRDSMSATLAAQRQRYPDQESTV
jgi:hypothetical protein